jgi:steroid 5-alpha reductase family enzyme
MALILDILALAAGSSIAMTGAWLVALTTGRSGWIDAIWSFATGALGATAALSLVAGMELSARQILVAALVLTWSLRLGLHLAARSAAGGDDPRYKHLFEEWGRSFKSRLFWFLQIQALVAFALALSVMIAAHQPTPGLTIFDGLGTLVFVAAVVGEGIADRQLTDFRKDPANAGKVCDTGLWAISRHPNYFFEWMAWLAYPIIALDFSGDYSWGWLSLLAPLLMYWLLVHVSGIPPLEAHMLRSRGAAFRRYQQRVNAFWPGSVRVTASPHA